MKSIYKIMMIAGLLAMTAGCGQKKSDFKYLLDEFAPLGPELQMESAYTSRGGEHT